MRKSEWIFYQSIYISGADTFHAQYDISKWLRAKLGRRKALAEKQRAATLQKVVKNPEMEDTLLEKALQEENLCARL